MINDKYGFDWMAHAQRLEAKIRELSQATQKAKSYIDELIDRGEGCNYARQISQRLDEVLTRTEKG